MARCAGVAGEQGEYPCKAVILATGGASYPATGSTGDGYAMAAELGHTVVDVKPSLVPLEAEGDLCPRMQGLALKNVVLKVKNRKNKVQFQEQGELLFTHFGLSGPLVLSASAHLRDFGKDAYRAVIDLKPAWMRRSWTPAWCGSCPRTPIRTCRTWRGHWCPG